MRTHHEIAQGVHYFPESGEIMGGQAHIQVNFFAVIGSKKNILIDTGVAYQAEDSIAAISKVINPADLDYIFLTHMDGDHIGGVKELLKIAPKARLVGNMTALGKGTDVYQLPVERFAVVFPGEEIDLGDRTLTVKESLVEDGHTSWLFDNKSHTFFTSDGFGALHFAPPVDFAENVPSEAFAGGFTTWQYMSFNMFPRLDVKRFRQQVAEVAKLDIQQIASVHGPIIRQDINQVLEMMEAMPTAEIPPMPALPPFLRLPAA